MDRIFLKLGLANSYPEYPVHPCFRALLASGEAVGCFLHGWQDGQDFLKRVLEDSYPEYPVDPCSPILLPVRGTRGVLPGGGLCRAAWFGIPQRGQEKGSG